MMGVKMANRRSVKENGDKSEKQVSRNIPFTLVTPPELKTVFSNNQWIQNTEHEFYITFTEVVPPLLQEGDREAFEKLESIESKVIARIVIPASRMGSFIKALQTNYDKYKKKVAGKTS